MHDSPNNLDSAEAHLSLLLLFHDKWNQYVSFEKVIHQDTFTFWQLSLFSTPSCSLIYWYCNEKWSLLVTTRLTVKYPTTTSLVIICMERVVTLHKPTACPSQPWVTSWVTSYKSQVNWPWVEPIYIIGSKIYEINKDCLSSLQQGIL